MPDFVEQGAPPFLPEGYRKSFDGDAKAFQTRMLAGDTRQAEMFVRDQLTTGFAPPSSPLADILPMAAGSSKPQAKYDPNTGKFYRSVVVDPSCVPASLPATLLMAVFCSDEMRYNPGSHTGVVLNISYNITVTCVGDTHVQADDMYSEVQQRVAALIRESFPSLAALDEPAGEVETCMGMTLFAPAAQPSDEECELVADSCAGISLFAPILVPQKQIRAVRAVDSCCGMTMFTAEEEEDDLSETETASPRSATGSLSSLKQFVADTCAGMTLFGNTADKQVDLEDLVADGVMGMTLYSPKGEQGEYDVHAETCNGVTTFTKCAPAPEAEGSGEEEGEDIASSCVSGFTDFTPALRKMQQDPTTYTAEQQWLSELAWGAAY